MVEKSSEDVVELCEKFFGPGLGSEQERNSALDEIVELGEHFADRHIGGESPGTRLAGSYRANANVLFVFPVAASA